MTELALATIPGFFVIGSGPSAGRAFGIYEPGLIPAAIVPQEVVTGGESHRIDSVAPAVAADAVPAPAESGAAPGGSTVRGALGRIAGARSGDKGGNANLGVFVRSDVAWHWLDATLTTERLRALLPEVAELKIDRHRFPLLRSLNFVVHGLLEEGVAASTRQDAQAKSLGEWLRAREVDIPEALLG